MFAGAIQSDPRYGFEWWTVERAFTNPRWDHLWQQLLVGLPPIGRGKWWMNCATPNGAITPNDAELQGFTLPGAWVDGYRGAWALEFDGLNDRGVIDDLALKTCFDLQNVFSVEAIICPTETDDVVVAAKRGVGYAWELRINADGAGNLLEGKVNADVNVATSALAINEGEWVQVGMTYDRQNIRVFINGREDGSAAFGAAMNLVNDDITLGSNLTGAPGWFEGRFATFRMWAKKLQESSYYQLWNHPYGMYQYANPVLVASNFVGKLAYPLYVTGDEYVRPQMDAGPKTSNVPFEIGRGNAQKVLPERPDMECREDAGQRTSYVPLAIPRGSPTYPHNANARGLDIRRDEKM